MEKITSKVLLEKYKKNWDEYRISRSMDFKEYPEPTINYELFLKFYKGIDCTINIMRNSNPFNYSSLTRYLEDQMYNQGQVETFSVGYMSIADKKKFIEVSNSYLTFTYVDDTYVTMCQETPEGVYELYLSQSRLNDDNPTYTLHFASNDAILPYTDWFGSTFEHAKYKMAHGNFLVSIPAEKIALPKINAPKEDFILLCNKIYRKGLPYVAELSKNGGTLEITEEDRKFYELTEEEKEMIQSFRGHSKMVEEAVQTSEKSKEQVNLSYPSNTGASKTEILKNLTALKELGIELSPEQKAMCELYEKLNSEKFQQYKANSEARKERQKQVRNEIAAENERRAEWQNSPENISNKRIEELELMKKRMNILENVKSMDASLLTPEQIELIERSKKFFEMLDMANSEQHEVDTGMSPEIRDWYQQHYSEEENIARK